jgi:hypothetical protein
LHARRAAAHDKAAKALEYAEQSRALDVEIGLLKARFRTLECVSRLRDHENSATIAAAQAERDHMMRSRDALQMALEPMRREYRDVGLRIHDSLSAAAEALGRMRVSLGTHDGHSRRRAGTLHARDGAHCATESLPCGEYCEISSLDELLSLHGLTFVKWIYRTLLRREPDPNGMRFYLARIRSGISRVQVIAEIALSAEGKTRRVELSGLHRALRLYKLKSVLVLGDVISFLIDITRESPQQKKMRALEEELLRHAEDNEEHIDHIQAGIVDLRRFVEAKQCDDPAYWSANLSPLRDDAIVPVPVTDRELATTALIASGLDELASLSESSRDIQCQLDKLRALEADIVERMEDNHGYLRRIEVSLQDIRRFFEAQRLSGSPVSLTELRHKGIDGMVSIERGVSPSAEINVPASGELAHFPQSARDIYRQLMHARRAAAHTSC